MYIPVLFQERSPKQISGNTAKAAQVSDSGLLIAPKVLFKTQSFSGSAKKKLFILRFSHASIQNAMVCIL